MPTVNHSNIKLTKKEVNNMKKFIYFFTVILSLVLSFSANAGNFTEKDVEKFITDMGTQSKNILSNTKLTAKELDVQYKKFTDKIVDSEWVARFILGQHYKQLTQAQRDEFTKLYREYLLENYIPKLKDYNKDLKVSKINKQKDTVYMVYTTTKDGAGRNVNVNFRVIERNNKLLITDIIPEGISFISSQRTDINSALTNQGYEKFIVSLKKKINK